MQEPSDLPPIRKIFSRLGLNKALQRIRFGGVVGKQTLIAIVVVVVLGGLALQSRAATLAIAVIIAVVALAAIILNFVYAHAHPVEAMMEGTEILAWQHQVLAAKYLQAPKDSPVIPNPTGEPPRSNPPEEIDAT